MTRRFSTAILLLLVGLCSGLPLAWMAWHLVTNPEVWSEFHLTAFRLDLLGRTLGYNLSAALIATALSIPAAIVIGRGRGVVATFVWCALPISLFMPSIVYTYGWANFLLWVWKTPDFQSAGDVARCVFSLATWLTPLPAFVIGLALRTIDANLQQQAMLDGALWRVTLRQLAGPIGASVLLCTVLAVQEFAVYEPTGISVIATELRMVFDTGAVSSTTNSMLAPIGGGASRETTSPDQRARAAAAVATAVPMLVMIAACGIVGAWLLKTFSAADAIDAGPWPNVLSAGWISKSLAIGVIALIAGVPLVTLVHTLSIPIQPIFILQEFAPGVFGSMLGGVLAGSAALLLAVLATLGRSRGAIVANLITFLVGGQLLAIALIRIYNRPSLWMVYDTIAITVIAYVAKFGWIGLAAGRFTVSHRWRELRDLAAVDGATPLQTLAGVILPIAWPLLVAGGVCVMVLSITEVSATLLLMPMKPQMLTPQMMSWVHALHFDPMIEASLLLTAIVAMLALAAVGLGWLGTRPILKSAADGRR